jgi:hypothetical protein
VFAAVPALSIYTILAQKYGFEGFSAAALPVATVLSFVSANLVLWGLGSALGSALGWLA